MPAEEAEGRLAAMDERSYLVRLVATAASALIRTFRDRCLASDAIMTAMARAALLRTLPARRPLAEAMG
jgi:hypothetical protein